MHFSDHTFNECHKWLGCQMQSVAIKASVPRSELRSVWCAKLDFKDVFKIISMCTCVSVWGCVHMGDMLVEAGESHWSSGAGVTRSSQNPTWVLGTKLESSAPQAFKGMNWLNKIVPCLPLSVSQEMKEEHMSIPGKQSAWFKTLSQSIHADITKFSECLV